MRFSAFEENYVAYHYDNMFSAIFGPVYHTIAIDESDDINIISEVCLDQFLIGLPTNPAPKFHILAFILKKSDVKNGTIPLSENNTFLFYHWYSSDYVDYNNEMNIVSITSGEMTISEYDGRKILGTFVIEGDINDDHLSTHMSIEDGAFSINITNRGVSFSAITYSGDEIYTDTFFQKCKEYDSSKHYQDCWWFGYCDESCQCRETDEGCYCNLYNRHCTDAL